MDDRQIDMHYRQTYRLYVHTERERDRETERGGHIFSSTEQFCDDRKCVWY